MTAFASVAGAIIFAILVWACYQIAETPKAKTVVCVILLGWVAWPCLHGHPCR